MGIDYTKISPGVRKLVQKLNEAGFTTTDSGDGSNYKEGPEETAGTFFGEKVQCAMPFPNVHIDPLPYRGQENYDPGTRAQIARLRTRNLQLTLESWGIYIKPGQMQLTHDPADESWILSLYNVSDIDLR